LVSESAMADVRAAGASEVSEESLTIGQRHVLAQAKLYLHVLYMVIGVLPAKPRLVISRETGNADGFADVATMTITLNERVLGSPKRAFSVLFHEVAHLMGYPERAPDLSEEFEKNLTTLLGVFPTVEREVREIYGNRAAKGAIKVNPDMPFSEVISDIRVDDYSLKVELHAQLLRAPYLPLFIGLTTAAPRRWWLSDTAVIEFVKRFWDSLYSPELYRAFVQDELTRVRLSEFSALYYYDMDTDKYRDVRLL
ncbi:MAG: hypothetical protein QXR87_01650, partial [Candidatus Hadarchaeales archaeon]